MAEYEVWGFTVRTSASGRNVWPNDLKREATRRIREEGQSAGDVAAEIGAHECLVRKWSVADRRSRGEKIEVEGPAFATVEGPAFASLNVEETAPKPTAPVQNAAQAAFGRILCGGLSIEFPIGASKDELSKQLQVARQFQ